MQPPLENVPEKRLSKPSFRDVFAIKAIKETFVSLTNQKTLLKFPIVFSG